MRIMLATRSLSALSLVVGMAMNAKAQAGKTESNHTLTAGTGIQLLNDEQLPLFARRLNSTALMYSFTDITAYRKKDIAAGFEKGIGNSGKDQARSNEFVLQYTDAFSVVNNKTGKWNNYTGYRVMVNPLYSKSGDVYSWATVNSVMLYNSLVYAWKENVISFDLMLPLAGFGSRPEMNIKYKGPVSDMLYNSFSNLVFTSLHNLKAVNVSLQYRKTITGRLYLATGICYSYKELSITRHFLQRAYRLHAGLSYRLI